MVYNHEFNGMNSFMNLFINYNSDMWFHDILQDDEFISQIWIHVFEVYSEIIYKLSLWATLGPSCFLCPHEPLMLPLS